MPDRQEEIVRHLEHVSREVAKQNSLPRMFLVGIVYGIGFFLGSAIIATIALGIFGPWIVHNVPGIQQAFTTGSALLHR